MTPSPEDHSPGLQHTDDPASGPAPEPSPQPYGIRLTWSQMPAQVHRWVEEILGAPVLETSSQRGGFSPGVADRVRTTDGCRAFVKACGAATNDRTPGLIADEARILSILPTAAGAPELLGARRDEVEGEDWALLVTEDIDGRQPHTPWVAAEVEASLAAYRRLATATVPKDIDLPTLPRALAREVTLLPALADLPPGTVDPWVLANLDDLIALTKNAPESLTGNAIVHLDARSDNLLLTTAGTVRIVDWPWACVGAPWMDSLCLGINARLYDPEADVEPHLEAHEELGGTAGQATTALTVLLGMFWYASAQPSSPRMPTLRVFQLAHARAVTAWLRHRLT